MNIFQSVSSLRHQIAAWRSAGLRIGFVPTMGNLHAGHVALIELARQYADCIVASVFVNPTQFGPNEDFSSYPRTPEADAAALMSAGCDALFLPSVDDMYPFGAAACVRVHVPGITDILCGAHRPGHFDGVTTVVARLFNMVQPDIAVFGSKDYQQLQIIRYLVTDLNFPIDIVPAPIVRESDGLAMSSRNHYLSHEQRQQAPLIYYTLCSMQEQMLSGHSIRDVESEAKECLEAAGFVVDYVEIRCSDLKRVESPSQHDCVGLIAARLGKTRLIDNLVLSLDGS